jgi:Zn-dependent M28 family amino/carboxypeptidase
MMMRMPRRSWVAVLATLLTTCTQRPLLEDVDLTALRGVADQVERQRLEDTVSDFAAAHATDTPIDCSSLEFERIPALCHLSRDKAGAVLQARLEELEPLRVRRQEAVSRELSTSNVIAELPGLTHPEEIILVGAHFDAYWMGADDNTSGVAAVLELARVLSRYRFDRTIRFVGFDLEELGMVGSNRYVDASAGERVVSSLIFDCIGYYSSAANSQQSLPGLPAPSVGDFLAVIGNEESSARASEVFALNERLGFMKVVPIIAPRDGSSPAAGNLLRSDHAPFWLTGQQSLFFTDTADFRNPNYHQETDTPDTLDFALYTQAVRLSAATLAYWAGGPR